MLGVDDLVVKALEEQRFKTAEESLKASKQNLSNIEAEIAMVQEKMAAYAEDDPARKEWEKTLEILEDEATKVAEEINSKWTEALQAAADNFQSEVERIMDTFAKANTGIYGSYDALQEAFNQ
jgi:septation ring formation regulator EzrA